MPRAAPPSVVGGGRALDDIIDDVTRARSDAAAATALRIAEPTFTAMAEREWIVAHAHIARALTRRGLVKTSTRAGATLARLETARSRGKSGVRAIDVAQKSFAANVWLAFDAYLELNMQDMDKTPRALLDGFKADNPQFKREASLFIDPFIKPGSRLSYRQFRDVFEGDIQVPSVANWVILAISRDEISLNDIEPILLYKIAVYNNYPALFIQLHASFSGTVGYNDLSFLAYGMFASYTVADDLRAGLALLETMRESYPEDSDVDSEDSDAPQFRPALFNANDALIRAAKTVNVRAIEYLLDERKEEIDLDYALAAEQDRRVTFTRENMNQSGTYRNALLLLAGQPGSAVALGLILATGLRPQNLYTKKAVSFAAIRSADIDNVFALSSADVFVADVAVSVAVSPMYGVVDDKYLPMVRLLLDLGFYPSGGAQWGQGAVRELIEGWRKDRDA